MERPNNTTSFRMNLLKKEYYKIYLVYILFGFGGLWHVLNKYQRTMQFLASPFIFAVTLLLLHDVLKSISAQSRTRFLLWCSFILFCGWGIEYVGVSTHFPFGHYQYGHVLQPQILQIPLGIGFAWLTICLSSLIITYSIMHYYQIKKPYHNTIIPILTAVFMLLFDIVMENAAPKLQYWTWSNGSIPIQNYLSWFLLGVLFSLLWVRLNISMKNYPCLGIHVYLSQSIYFLLGIFKK